MKVRGWVILAAVLMVAGDQAKDDPKKDLEPLQGTWKGVSGENDGNPIAEDAAKNQELIVMGDKYTLKVGGKEEEQGTLKLDPTKTPKTMDITITSGMDKGKTQLAIYQIDGDTFKICYAPAGSKDRPKQLSTKAGNKEGLLVLKKAKP
jgi:uncharacterized protein (TIGR03067 family)